MFDQAISTDALLTLRIGSRFYQGQLQDWKLFASTLKPGLITEYEKYRGLMSVTAFFGWLIREFEGRPPKPDAFGLIPVIPAFIKQVDIIDALIKERKTW